MVTVGWLSWFVEKTWLFFVGITVFRVMSLVMTPPTVSIPSDRGVTSRRRRSEPPSPERMPAWTAAPYATASSGLIPRFGSLPLKKSLMSACTFGMRVEPPTRTTSSTCVFFRPESSMTFFTGPRLLEEVAAELLEARPGQRLGEVLAVEESLNLEAGLVRRGERALRLLDFLAELLQRALVLGHVLAGLLVEDLDEVLHDTLVEVLASQVRVAVGRHNLEDAVVDREERDIECAATQIVDKDVLLRLLVQAVRNGSGGRLVDNAEDLHAGDRARILRGLALGVIEVRRHGDHRVLHLLAEVVLGSLLHLGEHHRRDLLRHELLLLALHLDLDHRLATLVHD